MLSNEHPHKKWYVWIDYAKVLAIYLVVLGHQAFISYPQATPFIWAFHIPLFFAISGFLYKPMGVLETLKHDWTRLVVPYLIINGICLVISLIGCAVDGHITWVEFGKRIAAILLAMGFKTSYATPVCSPSWFIAALFYIRLIMSVASQRQWGQWFIALLCIILTLVFGSHAPDVSFPQFGYPILLSSVMALPFFAAGEGLRYLSEHLPAIKHRSLWLLLIFILCLIEVLWGASINGRADLNLFQLGKYSTLFYLNAVCGIMMIFSLSALVCRCDAFRSLCSTISRGTILILGFHFKVIEIARRLLEHYGYTINNSIAFTMLFSAAVVLLFYPLILFCQRYFKPILGSR